MADNNILTPPINLDDDLFVYLVKINEEITKLNNKVEALQLEIKYLKNK